MPIAGCPPRPENIDDCVKWGSWAVTMVATGRLDAKTAREVGFLIRVLMDALEKQTIDDVRRQIEELKAGKLRAIG